MCILMHMHTCMHAQPYENGVNSVNKNQAQAIKSLADQLQCDEAVVKVIFSIVYPHVSTN